MLGAVLAALAIVPGVPAALAESAPAPSLRLVRASNPITAYRYGRHVYLDLGIYAAPTGGALELHAKRPDYESPLEVTQVDGEGNIVRAVPADLPVSWRGLDGFSTVTFKRPNGRLIATKTTNFCPNAYGRQRLDDSGPQTESFPDSCGRSRFPFLKGLVWGIDAGWAVNVLSGRHGAARQELPLGVYKVQVTIAPEWAEFFEIPTEDASVSLDLTVEEGRDYYDRRSAAQEAAPQRAPLSVPIVTEPDPNHLPDLAALPPWRLSVNSRRGKDWLVFAASPWNAGPARLVIEGFRRPDEDIMDAYQYFYDSDGNATGRAHVGEFDYDRRKSHQHWHFLQFARFSVLNADGTEVVRSKKQAFCLAPTDAVDLSVEGASYRPYAVGLDTQCGGPQALWVREVLDVGWADTYTQYAAGQSFNITNLPRGWYQVEVAVDPLETLYQKSTDNDSEVRMVRIFGKPGSRKIEVAPWHGITR